MEGFPIYTPVQLLGTFREDSKLPSFWRDLAFSGAPIFSDDRDIEFSKVNSLRRVAPFVSPSSEGVAIYNNRETVSRVTTAYIKLLDSVRAEDFTGKLEVGAGELGAGRKLTPAQRWNFRIAELTVQHETAINNRIELMCFEAIADGIVTVRDDDTNAVTYVNFGRDPSHTITLSGAALWSATTSDPLGNFTAWKTLARRPKGPASSQRFGSAPVLWIMGASAAAAFRANEAVKKELDLNYARTSQTRINTGVLDGLDIEYIGRLNNGDDVWMYNEYYEDVNGDIVPVMDPRDVIGINPAAVNGQIAFGTIANFKANLASMERFPNMFPNASGSEVYLSNESAPMVFPVNPNATLRARVLA